MNCRFLLASALSGLLLLSNVSSAAPAEAIPKAMELWPAAAPGATGTSEEDKPAIYPYLPAHDKATGAAILVCPGGGFSTRCADYEGVIVAQWLRERGIAAFILRYRIRPNYAMPSSLLDAQRGMQYLRAHADEFHISADRIGMIGFSAGAELASSASMKTLAAKAGAVDMVDRQPSRPNFVVLAYGSSPLRTGNAADDAAPAAGAAATPTPAAADASLPPATFMFCTAEDSGHLNGMLTLYTALRRSRVPVEAHFFVDGEHGVGMAQGDPVLGAWPDLMFNWVKAGGFLTAVPRIAVRGVIKVDGELLAHGSVIFTAVDSVGAPSGTGYVFNTGPVRGEFNIPQRHGLSPGKYRIEVQQDAMHWLSNSRDPVQLKFAQKRGQVTEQERTEFNDYMRHRDLSPSIDNLHVFKHKRPTDKEEMIVEIKPGDENHVDVEVFSK